MGTFLISRNVAAVIISKVEIRNVPISSETRLIATIVEIRNVPISAGKYGNSRA